MRRRAQLPKFLEIRARDIGMNSPGGAAQHRARGNTLCGAIRLVGGQRVGDLASALPAQPRARRCRGWTHAQRWSTGHLRRTTEWTVEGGVLKMGREHSDWTVLISPGHWVTIEMTQTQRSVTTTRARTATNPKANAKTKQTADLMPAQRRQGGHPDAPTLPRGAVVLGMPQRDHGTAIE